MILRLGLILTLAAGSALADESVCYGTTAKGRLENGIQIPSSGPNFSSYSDLEFDDNGRLKDYTIDFAAVAKHLAELNKAAAVQGVKISRVIFEVPLQKHLFATPEGAQLKGLMTFSTKQAWVKHDEHYHVDFELPCQPLEA